MLLFSGSLGYIRWAFSISNKIRRIVPVSVLAMVAATLVSQLTLMLASLLPLKIILLMGSPSVPRYFPRSFAAFDREVLVAGLGIAAVGFYLLHLMAEKFIAFRNERAAVRVLERAGKLTLFANQGEMARGAIRKFTRGMANTIFILAALALIAFIHFSVSLVIIGWCFVTFAGASLAGTLSANCRSWLESNAKSLIGSMSTVGNFIVVAAIIVEYIIGVPFNILFVVVGLILSRQIHQLLAASLRDALNLHEQKQQINALFFHGHALVTQVPERNRELWDLCRVEKLNEWLAPLIAKTVSRQTKEVIMTGWRETGVTDTITFEVSAAHADDDSTEYLVKLFGGRRRMLAAHESTLLAAVPAGGLSCPPFLGARRIGDADCHLFRELAGRQLEQKEIKKKTRDFLQASWSNEPPESIVRRYRRSHQLLSERISEKMGERLMQVALTPQSEKAVCAFVSAIRPIKAQLEALPLFVHCPDARPGTLYETESGQIMLTEWGRWTLEPIGAGWPTGKSALAEIEPRLKEARIKRPALTNVTGTQVRLAALAFAFQRHFARQRYNSALRLLPLIVGAIEATSVSDHTVREQAGTILKKTGS